MGFTSDGDRGRDWRDGQRDGARGGGREVDHALDGVAVRDGFNIVGSVLHREDHAGAAVHIGLQLPDELGAPLELDHDALEGVAVGVGHLDREWLRDREGRLVPRGLHPPLDVEVHARHLDGHQFVGVLFLARQPVPGVHGPREEGAVFLLQRGVRVLRDEELPDVLYSLPARGSYLLAYRAAVLVAEYVTDLHFRSPEGDILVDGYG